MPKDKDDLVQVLLSYRPNHFQDGTNDQPGLVNLKGMATLFSYDQMKQSKTYFLGV